MVQYIFTPWRDQRELLAVRQQFYPDRADRPPSGGPAAAATAAQQQTADRHRAVARVAMWMHRGHCPHLVESTALLTAAQLLDEEEQEQQQQQPLYAHRASGGGSNNNAGSSSSSSSSSRAYAVRAAYATAFGRFVTGLLDSHQDRARKLSMYALARTVGLPAALVELRHQAAHEPLPSLARLRGGAAQALRWIWEGYWVHLQPDDDDYDDDEQRGVVAGEHDSRWPPVDGVLMREVVRCLREGDERSRLEMLQGLARRFSDVDVLMALARAGESSTDSTMGLRAVRLSREMMEAPPPQTAAEPTESLKDVEQIKAEMLSMRERLRAEKDESPTEEPTIEDQGPAWVKHKGPWVAKPIGVI